MNLEITNWKPFQIDKIFDVYTGSDLIMSELEDGDIPIASNSAENNNIAAYTLPIKGRKLFDHTKSISIADRGKFWAFIQPKDFYIATRVKALVCKEYNMLNIQQLAFIVGVLNQESFKFTYGRNCCANLPNINISLPIQQNCDNTPILDNQKRYSEEGYIPDWEWMENYIKSLHHKPLTTKNKTDDVLLFNVNEWQEFRFGNLISSINKSKALNKDDLIETNNKKHSIRYITRTRENNGCELLVDISTVDKTYIQDKNAISIGDTTATCFYQDEDFITGDHMVIVRAEWLNKPLGLYVTSILNKEQYKYSYGRAFLMDRIKDTIIKLPIVRNSDKLPVIDESKCYSEQGYLPDWQWMEKYMKSLPYGDRL